VRPFRDLAVREPPHVPAKAPRCSSERFLRGFEGQAAHEENIASCGLGRRAHLLPPVVAIDVKNDRRRSQSSRPHGTVCPAHARPVVGFSMALGGGHRLLPTPLGYTRTRAHERPISRASACLIEANRSLGAI